MDPNDVHARQDGVQLIDVRSTDGGGTRAGTDAGLSVRTPDDERPGKVG